MVIHENLSLSYSLFMGRNPLPTSAVQPTVADINDYVAADGTIVIPDGMTLTSYFDRNRQVFGDSPSYRFIDYAKDPDGRIVDMSWNELWSRVRAVGARLQQAEEAAVPSLRTVARTERSS